MLDSARAYDCTTEYVVHLSSTRASPLNRFQAISGVAVSEARGRALRGRKRNRCVISAGAERLRKLRRIGRRRRGGFGLSGDGTGGVSRTTKISGDVIARSASARKPKALWIRATQVVQVKTTFDEGSARKGNPSFDKGSSPQRRPAHQHGPMLASRQGAESSIIALDLTTLRLLRQGRLVVALPACGFAGSRGAPGL